MAEKYLICSDIHDDVEALAKFADYAVAREADRIICCGDLLLRPFTKESLESFLIVQDPEEFLMKKREHSAAKLTEMKAVLDKTGMRYHVIPGNYDTNGDIGAVFNEHSLHRESTTFGDATVYGYGGADASPLHIQLLNHLGEGTEYSHDGLYGALNRATPDICIVHNPPQGLCDDMFNGLNVGSPALAQYILKDFPRLVLCGHIHEAGPKGNNPADVKGIRAVKNPENDEDVTVILNPGNLGRFELLNPRTLETQMQLDFGTFMELDVEGDGIPKRVQMYALDRPGRMVGQVKKLEEYEF